MTTLLLLVFCIAAILFHKPAMPGEKIDGRWLFAAAVVILAVVL